jgi:5'-3' exonuclease
VKELALIDGDLITYPCAAASENDGEDVAKMRANDLLARIIHEVNAQEYCLYISGSDNFRYDIYPLYKANRTQPKPIYLEAVREHLIKQWKAEIVNNIETDDRLGIESTRYGLSCVVCSFDKDMLQLPGHHYNWRRQVELFVSPYDGLRSFYAQVLAGDGADNIPSFDGKVRSKVPKFIEELQRPLLEMTEEQEMYDYVKSHYSDVDVLHRNCKLLYILRKEDEFWQPPQDRLNDELKENSSPN